MSQSVRLSVWATVGLYRFLYHVQANIYGRLFYNKDVHPWKSCTPISKAIAEPCILTRAETIEVESTSDSADTSAQAEETRKRKKRAKKPKKKSKEDCYYYAHDDVYIYREKYAIEKRGVPVMVVVLR